VGVGDERQHPATGKPLHVCDERLAHRLLELAACLLDDRGALDLDQRLLHVRVHAAHHDRQEVVAEQLGLRGDRLAMVVALVQRDHALGYRFKKRLTGVGWVGGRNVGLLSCPPSLDARKGENGPDER